MLTAADSQLRTLRQIENRVLWLAMAIIDHANRVRPNPGRLKVGGHQASSASLVTIMTSLWFRNLTAEDRVSVKPHASPVLHAINYLLGDLDPTYLTTLREFGGLQAYPSRSKDPDRVDYSTGSVGIGATAPIWGAFAHRYVAQHFGGTAPGRQISLVGDAELEEGACWEAVLDPMVAGLGEVVWIVDLNRQSLDRVAPTITAGRYRAMFEAAGWQVIVAKYGSELEDLFALPDGAALRDRVDAMSNAEYQRMLRCTPDQLPERLLAGAPDAALARFLAGQVSPEGLHRAIRNLGGHDFETLDRAFAGIDDTRPTVILAYTVKGHGLASEGHPQNHSALVTEHQLGQLGDRLGVDPDDPWRRFPDDSAESRMCREVAARLSRPAVTPSGLPDVPLDLGRTPGSVGTTQAALGRTLLELTRAAPQVGARVVTVSPDVASSTNLGGWVNKVGVWSFDDRPDWFRDDAETVLHWDERSDGQHIELGIAETNLVGLIGELGATWSRWGEPLIPIGVLYDPFVERALEPWSFGIYSGGQSILVGTPSGVTLAPEGGAHQSIKTPSIGMEQPGCVSWEPAFAIDTEWVLLAAMASLARPDGTSAYLRLSTSPVDQSLAGVPVDPGARERRRAQVVAGGYVLRRGGMPVPRVTVCAMGAVVPQAIAAAEQLEGMQLSVDVVCITSADLLFRATQARRGMGTAPDWILDEILCADRAAPLVTVLDGHPHALAFLAGVNGVPATHLGVVGFGQSGDLASVYAYHRIDADAIVAASLDLVD